MDGQLDIGFFKALRNCIMSTPSNGGTNFIAAENRRFGPDRLRPEDFGQDVLDLSRSVLPSPYLLSQSFLAPS